MVATKSPKTQGADALHALCASLRFRGMGQSLDAELARAQRLGSPVEEVLARLLSEEARSRQERSLDYRIRQARLPWDWTLETFPFHRQPSARKAHILSLADLSFLARADNIVFIGDPGTGKTGLAVGLLRKALQNGHRGLFIKAQDLLDELYASLADRSTTRLLRRLARIEVLVIDELGYLSLQPEQVNAFFQLMDQRYARTSTILTTNLDYPDWYPLFDRKPLVDALLDRLQHHCVTIRIQGPSLRVPDAPTLDDDPSSS
jgi:DNA replication protein DnaC